MIASIGIIDGLGKLAEQAGAATSGAGASAGIGNAFSVALSDAASATVDKLHHAEQLSVKALQGGDIQTRDVVDAVMNAEQSLQAAVAIRDKIISAYLEVSRMAI
ncbi:flagellar hook-basal body complex protein FliE [Mesorhizobium sp. NBSH29]|uniref:flagellar hook-basal body complex protein FliE n=1 Tax=Mesorhizobium sp. NBSH29 TaxID=2654249 RepID=UPI001896429E|nr:flagellar hook-basal body complex protein FliE [Mesorhizobium sp. NBSH29]QPC85387.1 flagellar hook-basal body complex protein FliE [Mesorhizobium sp. NBSH29]